MFVCFSLLGFLPDRKIAVLPVGLNFDGRSAVIRSQQTHLTRALCNAMMAAAETSICVFNSGAIRIDDQLMETITEYDILRCLPFAADVIIVRVTGSILVKVLNRGLANINTGMFISYAGVNYDPIEGKWFLSSTGQLLDDEHLQLQLASIPYFFHNTVLKDFAEFTATPVTITRAFIEYLERAYPRENHPQKLS